MPGRPLAGHVKEVGGTSGQPWNRHFECRLALDEAAAELRPGMSANIVVTTDQMKGVLSCPRRRCLKTTARRSSTCGRTANFTEGCDARAPQRNARGGDGGGRGPTGCDGESDRDCEEEDLGRRAAVDSEMILDPLSFGFRAGWQQPLGPEDAHRSDGARNHLRRGRGDWDACDRGGRAGRIAAVH